MVLNLNADLYPDAEAEPHHAEHINKQDEIQECHNLKHEDDEIIRISTYRESVNQIKDKKVESYRNSHQSSGVPGMPVA